MQAIRFNQVAKRTGVSRRSFLRTSVAAASGTIVPTAIAAEDPKQANWIDAHVHVWTPDTKQFPLAEGYSKRDMVPGSFTPSELMKHAAPAGVSRVVLIQMSFYGVDNSYMLKVIRAHPGVYSGVAVIDSESHPASRMKALAKQGVRGFRLYHGKASSEKWLQGPGMEEMWKCGADEGLAMCLLLNPQYLPSVIRMCRRYPRTPVVIDHFARIGMDGRVRTKDLDNLCQLARFQHTAVKTSAFYALGNKRSPYRDLGPMIRRLRDTFGAERLMWASDCPYQVQAPHNYADSIDLIQQHLEFLRPEEIQWMLKRTAERVFFA